ncbi:DEAD/DEAH box helicase [Candidatus Parcubacteria bacterium]|nr:MAG: DEAD/DEAH box helicase [Candidatus Parcubacteria bacterium]
MTQFKDLGLGTLVLKGLSDLGFEKPSEIQAEAIPFIVENKQDLIALAQTGTGKTAAFSLPILEMIDADKKDLQAMVICTTRELCLQISQDIRDFSKYIKGINVVSVYWGERVDLQLRNLKKGANIVVGTPGRLHDFINRNKIKTDKLEYLVLDEADEMLDMGFKDDLDAILENASKNRQTLLFSATFSASVRKIAKEYMKEAKEIKIGKENAGAVNVKHEYYIVEAFNRYEALERIIDSLSDVYGIIFCRTKIETQEVADKLKQSGYDAEAIHGDINQNTRTKIMASFKKRVIKLLVATDVASRGIDVSDLTHVINYNLPTQEEAYTHRSGRTGRANNSGTSISICGIRDLGRIKRLEKMIGQDFLYKKVPSLAGIIDSKIDTYINKIETEAPGTLESNYCDKVIERMKKIKKEDLIKFLIQEKFGRIINSNSVEQDLNADLKKTKKHLSGPNVQALRLSIGKKQRADIKTIFALINSNKDTKGMDVGRVIVKQNYSMISVSNKDADKILDSLDNESWRGQRLMIERSNEALSASRSAGRHSRRRRRSSSRRR